ncbi:MAG: hypothetical protein Tsb002_10810 [Wenzhouxiangellaceae bacterium]
MQSSKHGVIATLICSLALATAPTILTANTFSAINHESAASETDVASLSAAAEAQLAQQRKHYIDYFDTAYQQYPKLPTGVLEALAYVQTRWVHLQPESVVGAHHGLPQPYGVMGLYNGAGFADQLSDAATLLGVSPQQIASDPQTNILAAAALLDQYLTTAGDTADLPVAALATALKDYAGFALVDDSRIQQYARDNFAYDVLLALDRGIDDHGIRVPERPVAWEEAFDLDTLVQLQAPFVRLDLTRDAIEVDGYHLDPRSETLLGPVTNPPDSRSGHDIRSTDYGPALWVASPYHSTRSATASAVTIHTMQGSYAGTISWFQNNPVSVSAHYLVRSSDGQVTQMVRENRAAHHVRSHNGYTLGIEHEGFVENGSSWYTTAMYNASSALTRHFCSRYGISCASAYSGAGHSGVVVLPTSTRIKGHQHFSGNTHVDPGVFWDWSRYHGLLNPGGGGGGGGGGTSQILDSFEGSEGHFNTSPTYSGSTVGISTSSTADRVCTIARNGNCSERIKLVDNSSTSANWAVRFLSGSGRPSSNTSLTRSGGRVGFWVYSGGTGMSVGLGIDDSDGTERSTSKSIPANSWTFVQWNLDDAGQWNPWVGGNGAITASSVTLDAIWLYRAQTSFDVFVYIDDVQYIR